MVVEVASEVVGVEEATTTTTVEVEEATTTTTVVGVEEATTTKTVEAVEVLVVEGDLVEEERHRTAREVNATRTMAEEVGEATMVATRAEEPLLDSLRQPLEPSTSRTVTRGSVTRTMLASRWRQRISD